MDEARKIKLAYCIVGNYEAGGHQAITATKVNYLVGRGYEIYLITSSQGGRPFFYPIDPRVKHIDLDVRHDIESKASRLGRHWERYQKRRLHHQRLEQVLLEIRPDITIVPGYYENYFAYKIKDGSVKIIEHHSTKYWNVYLHRFSKAEHPTLWMELDRRLRLLWGRLCTALYSRIDRHYDVLVLLTEEDRQGFLWHKHTEVIPNPKSLDLKTPSTLSEKVALGIGRLVPSKNFGELISIWAEVAGEFPDWKLRILGGGHLQESLEKQVQRLGLEQQVELLGQVTDMPSYYLSASLCVSTSHYEGLPLFLVEAETAGLPLLSYACPCGPRDIIQEGQNGYLVEPGDRTTFVARLRELLSSEELRRSMGQAGFESSQRYAPEAVMKQWEDLFASLLEK